MKPIIRQAGEGERYWFYGGGLHLWKATVEDTAGAFFCFEDELVKGKTTPLHQHPEALESVFVLDGEILVHVDGEEHVVRSGGFTLTPPKTPHAFLVTSQTARVLGMQMPGEGQSFYIDASEPATEDLVRDAPIDIERLRASAAANPRAITLLGPPPFMP